MSFNFREHVFDGSCGYSYVEVKFKGANNCPNTNVYLIEVPDPEETTRRQEATNVGKLGTIDILKDEYVIKEFKLPDLEIDKKYVVALESSHIAYYLSDASTFSAEDGIHPYTLGTITNSPYIEDYYDAYHGRGSYIYSYFQMRFK